MLGLMTLEVSASLEEFVRLISCYDFRVERILVRGKPLPKTTKYWLLERLGEMARRGEVFLRHLSYLRPLGVRVAFGFKGDPVLAKTLLNIGELDVETVKKLGFPLPYLFNTVAVVGGGRVFASWIIPPGVDPGPVMDWGEVVLGEKVPVMTCHPHPKPGDVWRLGSRLSELLETPQVKPRTPVVPYILLAALDMYELLTFKEMARLETILSSRDVELDESVRGELKWKYLRKYYFTLSSRKVLGRIRVVPRHVLTSYPRVTLVGEPECARDIYGVTALKGYAGHIYYSNELVVANMLIDNGVQELLKSMADKCFVDTMIRYRTMGFPFPFELYDPLEDKWHTRPVEGFARLLRKLRLLKPGGV